MCRRKKRSLLSTHHIVQPLEIMIIEYWINSNFEHYYKFLSGYNFFFSTATALPPMLLNFLSEESVFVIRTESFDVMRRALCHRKRLTTNKSSFFCLSDVLKMGKKTKNIIKEIQLFFDRKQTDIQTKLQDTRMILRAKKLQTGLHFYKYRARQYFLPSLYYCFKYKRHNSDEYAKVVKLF